MAIIPKLPVANLGDILKGEKFIEKGANFEGLLSEVISVCSQCKLLLICARLLRFAEQKIHSFFQVRNFIRALFINYISHYFN